MLFKVVKRISHDDFGTSFLRVATATKVAGYTGWFRTRADEDFFSTDLFPAHYAATFIGVYPPLFK